MSNSGYYETCANILIADLTKGDRDLLASRAVSYTQEYGRSKRQGNLRKATIALFFSAKYYRAIFDLALESEALQKSSDVLMEAEKQSHLDSGENLLREILEELRDVTVLLAPYNFDLSNINPIEKAIRLQEKLLANAKPVIGTHVWLLMQEKLIDLQIQAGAFKEAKSAISKIQEMGKLDQAQFYKNKFGLLEIKVHLELTSAKPNRAAMTEVLELYRDFDAVKLEKGTRFERLELNSLYAENSADLYSISENIAHLHTGLLHYQVAMDLWSTADEGNEKLPVSPVVNFRLLKIGLAEIECDKSTLNQVIKLCATDIDEFGLNKNSSDYIGFLAVLVWAYAARSNMNNGSISDIAKAKNILSELDQYSDGQLRILNMRNINARYNEAEKTANANFNPKHVNKLKEMKHQKKIEDEDFDLDGNLEILFDHFQSVASAREDGDVETETKLLEQTEGIFLAPLRATIARENKKEIVTRTVGDQSRSKKSEDYSAMLRMVSSSFKLTDANDEVTSDPAVQELISFFAFLGEQNLDEESGIEEWFAFENTPELIFRISHFLETTSEPKKYRGGPSYPFAFSTETLEFYQYHYDVALIYLREKNKKFGINHLRFAEISLVGFLEINQPLLPPVQKSKLFTRLGMIYRILAHLESKAELYVLADSLFRMADQALSPNRELSLWVFNQSQLALSIQFRCFDEGHALNFEYAEIHQRIFKYLKFEERPFQWIKYKINHCRFFENTMKHPPEQITEDANVILKKVLMQFTELNDNALFLLQSTKSIAKRTKLVRLMATFGDLTAYLWLLTHGCAGALKFYDKTRAIRLSTGLFEDALSKRDGKKLRKLRLAWERNVEDVEQSSLEVVNSLSSEAIIDRGKASLSTESSMEAFRQYQEAIESTGAKPQFDLDHEKLFASFPAKTLLCTTIITNSHIKLILLGEGKNGSRIFEDITLKNVGTKALRDLLLGENGWLKTYKEFRELLGSEKQAAKDQLQVAFERCNQSLAEASEALGTHIFQPLYDTLSTKQMWDHIDEIMFVPNGVLSMLPLQAAKIKEAGGEGRYKYLIQEKAMSLWPNLKSVVHYLEKNSIKSNSSAATLMVDGIGGVADNFPKSLNYAPSHNRQILRTKRMKKIRAKDVLSALEKCDYSYFYCHGHWNNETPESSNLQLDHRSTKQRHLLSVKDVRHSNFMNSRLCFLGSCESAMIDTDYVPNEFVGLPAAFMEAGIGCVIATQWAVHKDLTLNVADKFFSNHFEKGLPPPQALRLAVLDASGLRSDGSTENAGYDELMYWAPFVVWGN